MEIDLEIFGQETGNVFLESVRLALQMGHRFVGSEHLLWALLQTQGAAGQILRIYGLDQELIGQYLEKYDWDVKADGNCVGVQVSEDVEQVIHYSEQYTLNQKNRVLTPEGLLYGILGVRECAAAHLMRSLEIDIDEMRSRLDSLPQSMPVPRVKTNGIFRKGKEALSVYGTDITQKSRDGAYDPLIGREDMIERLIQILARRTKITLF